MEGISKLQQARALRTFQWNAGLSGAFGPLGGMGSTIFTGLALWMGLQAPQIGFFSTAVALAGMVYFVSGVFASWIRHQKAFLIVAGCIEITLMCLPPLVAVLFAANQARFLAIATLALLWTVLGNLRGPLHTSWHTMFVSDDVRARFVGRQGIIATVVSMVVGFAAGQFVDRTGRGYVSFLVPYIAALGIGLTGFLIQVSLPFPAKLAVEDRRTPLATLLAPLRDGPFRTLMLFNLILALGDNIFGPFSGVFFLQEIRETYSYLAIVNVASGAISIAAYGFFIMVIERFGAKPIIRATLFVRIFMEALQLFLTPTNYVWLHTIVVVLASATNPGLSLAVTTCQWGLIPESRERSSYFASWAFAHSILAVAVTAAVSGIAGLLSSFSLAVGPVSFSYLKLFLLVKLALVPFAIVVLSRVPVRGEQHAPPLGHILVGNPISFAYHTALLGLARSAPLRARTLRGLGQSRSPLAVPALVKAMDDADPDVRAQAVHGLGDSGSQEAVAPLADELVDTESHLRAEAATSLGRIGHPGGIEPLSRALADPDLRVRMSAIRALADIGGGEARERLFEAFGANQDRMLIPTFVDSLGRLGDVRIIGPALEAMREFTAPVIRLQLLNAVCRALGAGNDFYALLALEELSLVQRLDRMQRVKRRLLPRLPPVKRFLALECLEIFSEALEKGRYGAMPEAASVLAETLRGRDHPGARALRLFNELHRQGVSERPEIFTLVVLERILA